MKIPVVFIIVTFEINHFCVYHCCIKLILSILFLPDWIISINEAYNVKTTHYIEYLIE